MAMELIETIEVGAGGAASIEFTSIPQDGVDLLLKISSRNYSTTSHNLELKVNDNTASNVSTLYLLGTGSSVLTSAFSPRDYVVAVGGNTPSSATANTFSNFDFYLSNYTSSNAKSASINTVNENNGTTAYASISAVSLGTTAAINKITVSNYLGQYSTASLYKIY